MTADIDIDALARRVNSWIAPSRGVAVSASEFEQTVLSSLGYGAFATSVHERSRQLSSYAATHLHAMARKQFGWRRPGGLLSILSVLIVITCAFPIGFMFARYTEPAELIGVTTWIIGIAGILNFFIAIGVRFRPVGRGAYLPIELSAVLLVVGAVGAAAIASPLQRTVIFVSAALAAIGGLGVLIRRLGSGHDSADASGGFTAVIAATEQWQRPKVEELTTQVTAEFAAGAEAEHVIRALRLRAFDLLTSDGFDTSQLDLTSAPAIPIIKDVAYAWILQAQPAAATPRR